MASLKKEDAKKQAQTYFSLDLKQNIISLPEIPANKADLDVTYDLLKPYASVHIHWDEELHELVYSVIEPDLDSNEKATLELVEEGIRELINISFLNARDERIIMEYLEKNVRIILNEFHVRLSQDSFLKIMYYIWRNFVGLNEIEALMRDYYIEDIECNGFNTPIYIIHRKYRNIRTNIQFNDLKSITSFVEKLAQKCGQYISYATPLLDGRLPDGSIDWNEPIIFRENSIVKIRKIGEFIDKYYKNEESDVPKEVKNIEVPAFDQKELKINWKNADYVYRHKLDEKLYYIKLETGRKLRLTGSHSIFVLRKDGLRSELTSNIKEGDYVAIPLKIPDNNIVREINLAKELANKEYSHKLCLENIPYEIFIKKKDAIKEFLNNNYKKPYFAYYELREKRMLPLKLYHILSGEELRNAKIKTTSHAGVPTFLEINKKLMRLLGYYIAEGWLSNPEKHHNYDIMFCMHTAEKEHHQEIISAFKMCFNHCVYVEPECNNAIKLKCTSYIVWHIFKDILQVSKYAKNKRIPDIIFNVDPELRKEFIKAYANGDYGSSASEMLMSDLLYINLFETNIFSYYDRERTSFIGKRPITSREFYTNNLFKEQTDYFKMIPIEMFNPLKNTNEQLRCKRFSRTRLTKILSGIRYKRFMNLDGVNNIKFLKEWQKRDFIEDGKLTEKGKDMLNEISIVENLIDSDLAYLKVKEIKRIESSSKFVYDVSVKGCENFVAGYGGICCHNSRINATYSSDVATRGPNFTVRKFSLEPWTPIKMIDFRTASPEVLAYLWILLEYGANIMIVGATASGKTSFLNAIAFFIHPSARIITIEDTKEINLMHENWLPSVSRSGIGAANLIGQKYGEVTLFDLLRESFRQRPDYVVVGEIRGKEAFVLFQGASSGHPVMSTMHAESVESLIRRLETEPINLSPTLVESLDCVCVVSQATVGGKPARRLQQVVEIIKVEKEVGRAITNTPLVRDPKTDKFYFKTKSTIFDKIILKHGISKEQLDREFLLRAKLLYKMYQSKIFGFAEVQSVINDYYKMPSEVLKKFKIT